MQKNMKAIMEYLRDHGLPMKKLVSEETLCRVPQTKVLLLKKSNTAVSRFSFFLSFF